jgi:hypothetical protein
MGAATPFVVGATAIAGFQQAGAIGNFNRNVANRNALVKEQEAKILDDKLALELGQFDKSFRKLQGSQKVRTLKSGAEFSGTARNIQLSNLYEAELERNIRKYNTDIGKLRKFEEANFARISGDMAKMSSRMQQINILSSAGQSLLSMGEYSA